MTNEQSPDRTPIPGSERKQAPTAALSAPVDPDTAIEVTIVLRRRGELADADLHGGLTREELAAKAGADPADVQLVASTVEAAGAFVLWVDAPSRRLRIGGAAATLQKLFGTSLVQATVTTPGGHEKEIRHRVGALSVPGELDGVVTAVLGLDDRPQARARFEAVPAHAVSTSYTPLDLAAIYGMPASADGTGQHVAIIELGGGFGQADLDAYFGGLGVGSPNVSAVLIDGATNVAGGDPRGADGEVLLDIDVLGAIAPKATILVYFAPNTDAGFLDAVSAAAHADPTPAAISISWGQSEDQWTDQGLQAMDQAFADACALGVTVTTAAGDNGSSDDPAGGAGVHVDFPASSPHTLACGGTNLVADTTTHAVSSETVWNNGVGRGATGGGVSDVFPLPSWQATAGVGKRKGPSHGHATSGRGVPDVSAVADPQTGYQVLVDGTRMVIGGTSAVAPLWAALVCRYAQLRGRRFGLLQPAIYATASPGKVPVGFRDITKGGNGRYKAAAGWDSCTGLGVPDGGPLLDLFPAKGA
jgi:kumamolisin